MLAMTSDVQLDLFGSATETPADDPRLLAALARLRTGLRAIGHDPDDCRVTKLRYDRAAGWAHIGLLIGGKASGMRAERGDVVLAIEDICAAVEES